MRTYLRVDDTSLDTVISSLIVAARLYCEAFQNRTYVTQTWEWTLDSFPNMPLKLPNPPLQSVSNITYTDKDGVQTTWDVSNYIVDTSSEPGRITFSYGNQWPDVTLQPVNGFKIQFISGYGDATAVPENVKNAIKIYVAHRFENPEQQDIPQAVDSLLWNDRIVPV